VCAASGHNLILAARNEQEVIELADQCQRLGTIALGVKTDISKKEDAESLMRQAIDVFGRVDVWINDAAVAAYGDFEAVPIHCVEQVINTNVMGYIYGSRVAVGHFKRRKAGVLINVSSISGVIGQPLASSYAVSKFAIRGLCLTLQAELAEYTNIHVCCVMPSCMDTPFFQHAANYTGRGLQALPPAFDPIRVAQKILKVMDKPMPEIFVGLNPVFLVIIRTFFPRFFAKAYWSYILKNQFTDTAAGASDGNIFVPMEGGTVTGGWRK
jgi:short-subunit dehydrogenase